MLLQLCTFVVIAVVVHGSLCNDYCDGNNECKDPLCSYCHDGRCIKGLSCGSSCTVTTDCNQEDNCTHCTLGVCTTYCGESCTTDQECWNVGCSACVNNSCALWQCGNLCEDDSRCFDGGATGCVYCNITPGTKFGLCYSGCGATCSRDSDCVARCPYCSKGTCTFNPPN